MSRIIKKKLINCMLNKKRHKFCGENLIKFNLKLLNINNKKQPKYLIYLALNQYLPIFQLATKKIRIKKIKILKYKPFIIFQNKNRIFYSIKFIINFNIKQKLNFKHKILLLTKNKSKIFENGPTGPFNRGLITANKNLLVYYRWH